MIKLQQAIFAFNAYITKPNLQGSPLIPDGQGTRNRDAVMPRTFKVGINGVIDQLGLDAILADVENTKKLTTVEISLTNPDRVNIVANVKLSGNANQLQLTNNFGFNFGVAQVA